LPPTDLHKRIVCNRSCRNESNSSLCNRNITEQGVRYDKGRHPVRSSSIDPAYVPCTKSCGILPCARLLSFLPGSCSPSPNEALPSKSELSDIDAFGDAPCCLCCSCSAGRWRVPWSLRVFVKERRCGVLACGFNSCGNLHSLFF
jgi:hypothetical protein